jgi:hypothetical protein
MPAESNDGLHCGPAGQASTQNRPARAWLGRLSTYIASFAGGMAVNDASGTLGYHGLAGAVALSGVVTAAVWIRGLDPRARLFRHALWLFLMPAGCAAAIAAFSWGSTASVLAGLAAVSTVGAVLVADKLEAVARLLAGAGLVAFGTAYIAGHGLLLFRPTHLVGRVSVALFRADAILYGAVMILLGAALISGYVALFKVAVILPGAFMALFGAVSIAFGAMVIASRQGILFWETHIEGRKAALFGAMHIAGREEAALGALLIWVGAIFTLGGAMFIVGLKDLTWAEVTEFRAEVMAYHRGRVMAAAMACCVTFIASGAVLLADRHALLGTAAITLAAAFIAFAATVIGPSSIAVRARQVVEWATKAPRS